MNNFLFIKSLLISLSFLRNKSNKGIYLSGSDRSIGINKLVGECDFS